MKSSLTLAVSLLICAALLPAAAHAQAAKRAPAKAEDPRADSNVIACVSRIIRDYKPDGSASLRAHFVGERTSLTFYPDYMAYVGTVPGLTAAQVQRWQPELDLLRDAAQKRVRVALRIDGASNKVESLEVRYEVPC